MNWKLAILSFTGILIAFSGCGKSADQVTEDSQNKITANGNPAINNATYAGACVSSTLPDIGPIKFPGMQTFFEMSSLVFTKHIVYYSDAACKTPILDIRETGDIHVVGTAVVAGALDEDFNYSNTILMVQDDTVLAAFNVATVCGINDWAKNLARDVSPKASVGTCPGKPTPRKTADIVLVQNNQLTLGADADQVANQARPAQIDNSKIYTKQ